MRSKGLKLCVIFSALLSGCSGIFVKASGPSTQLCSPVVLNSELLGFDCINYEGDKYFIDPHKAKGSLLIPAHDYRSLLDYCTIKGSR